MESQEDKRLRLELLEEEMRLLQMKRMQDIKSGNAEPTVQEMLTIENGNDFGVENYLEPIARGAGSYVGTMINGLYSLPQALMGGESADTDINQFKARQMVIDEFAKPKTDQGKRTQKALEWVAEKMRVPVSGIAGIAELFATQNLDSAVQAINDVQAGKRDFGDVLAEANYNATGDPVWAAAVKTLGTGFPDILGAGFAAKPYRIKALEDTAKKLQEQTTAMSKTPELGAGLVEKTSSDYANKKLVEIDGLLNQQKRIDAQTIEMLDDEMRRDPEFAKGIAQQINSKPDGAAKRLLKQGASKGNVASMKMANAPTRRVMNQMLRTAEDVLNDASRAAEMRPSMAMGDIINRRIRFIDNKRKDVGQKVRASLGDFDNAAIPVEKSDPIARKFLTNLENLGVQFDDASLRPIFDDSSVRDIPKFKALITRTLGDLSNGVMTPKQLHMFKKRLDQNISYGKNIDGLGGELEVALKELRGDINGYLGEVNPRYREANNDYAALKTAIDNAERGLGLKKKLKLDASDQEAVDVAKIGEQMRKTLSRYQQGVDIRSTLKEIEDTAKNYGLNDGVQVNRLIAYENMLDEMMPSLVPRSFSSQVASGIDKSKVGGIARNIADYAQEQLIDKGVQFMNEARGINEVNAAKSIKQMLRELEENNRKAGR